MIRFRHAAYREITVPINAVGSRAGAAQPGLLLPGTQSSRLAVFGGRGMSFNICRGTLGSLAMFTAIRNASSRMSWSGKRCSGRARSPPADRA